MFTTHKRNKKFFAFVYCKHLPLIYFSLHYRQKCVFIAEDGHVTRNILNNKCFFKVFLALLVILDLGEFQQIYGNIKVIIVTSTIGTSVILCPTS